MNIPKKPQQQITNQRINKSTNHKSTNHKSQINESRITNQRITNQRITNHKYTNNKHGISKRSIPIYDEQKNLLARPDDYYLIAIRIFISHWWRVSGGAVYLFNFLKWKE